MGCRPPGGDVRTSPLDEGLGSDPSPEASGLRRQEVGSGQEAGLNATCTGCDRPWGRRRHPTAILVREGREARLTPRSQGPCDPSRLHPSLGFTASSAPCSIKGDIPPSQGPGDKRRTPAFRVLGAPWKEDSVLVGGADER